MLLGEKHSELTRPFAHQLFFTDGVSVWQQLKPGDPLGSTPLAAYIGSANVTSAGIAGPNLELDILVRGQAVAVVERVLGLYQESDR